MLKQIGISHDFMIQPDHVVAEFSCPIFSVVPGDGGGIEGLKSRRFMA